MALSVGDIVQITDVQTYLTNTMLNVYFYEVTALDSLADYADLAEAFDNVVRSKVLPLQMSTVVHPFINIKNLTNGLDIWDQIDSQSGGIVSGDGEPSFMALGFRLNRSTAATRHGSKRIGGIAEALVSGNSYVGSVPAVNDLATAMGGPIERSGTVDHDLTAVPVIVGRFPADGPNAGELDLSVINPVAGAQFVRVTTQNTRKPGRGI